MASKREELETDLAWVLNKNSVDATLGIPDFILATMVVDNLYALEKAQTAAKEWLYGE